MTEEFRSNRRRFRVLLLGVGSLLWIVVFVWIAILWNKRSERSEETTPQTPVVKLPTGQVPTFQPYELPDFQLTAHDGRTVKKQDLLGRPWVASFIFTRCTGECKMIDDRMQKFQNLLKGTDIRLLTFTVDPKYDTKEVLQRHAKSLDADPDRWLFLTGPPETVYPLINRGFKISAMENTGKNRLPGLEVTHSQRILYVDAKGWVVGSYLGTSEYDMARLRQKLLDDHESPAPKPGKSASTNRDSKTGKSGP